MVKMKLIGFIIILLSAGSCHSMKIQHTSKSCIEQYIDSNKNKIDWPVGYVDEYEFQGKLVYAFGPPSNYADFTTQIKTSDCKDLCSIGGFAGPRNSNCNGENFYKTAVLKRRVWSRTSNK